MKVVPFETGRFKVESQERGRPPYLVDVSEHNGQGWCDCDHYRIEMESKNRRGACKHIAAVWLFLGREVVKEMVKQERTNDE